MSFVLTYNTLVARITSYLERVDQFITDDMDLWIKMAHERIGRDSNTLIFDVYVTQAFQANVAVMQKPNRWQNTLTFNYGTGDNNNTRNQILPRTYEWCRAYWPDDTLTDAPKYYANYGNNNWLICPTPDQAYPFELGYSETPQVIDINFQTNYLTEFMPEVLFKAVLLEAMIGLKNYEYIPPLEADYVKVLASWNSKDKFRKTDRYTNLEAD